MHLLSTPSSPYLQAHAQQPVPWYGWGQEAFAQAQQRNAPVLVSLGHQECEGCQAMARECYQDPFIADLMNRRLVCIKIDRDALPDVAQLYLHALQLLCDAPGWPANLFCLPNGMPFFGGTYFPPEMEEDRLSWPQLVLRVSQTYALQQAECAQNAYAVAWHLLGGQDPQEAQRTLGGLAWPVKMHEASLQDA